MTSVFLGRFIRTLALIALTVSCSLAILSFRERPDIFVRQFAATLPADCSATEAYRLSWHPPAPAKAPRVDLSVRERKYFSQTGEAGVIDALFDVIEPAPKFAVEFGAMDGVTDSLTRHLILDAGWGAYLIEGDPARAEALKKNYQGLSRVRTQQAWVFPGSIEILFEDNDVPRDLDLLTIDIDSNDYYVWRALTRYRPKVVAIEYNAGFPPPIRAVVDFHPMNFWDGSDYYGASLQSLADLGKTKGYELVYANSFGTTAFFVAAEYYPLFGISDNSPEQIYRLPLFGVNCGGRAPNGRGWPAFEHYSVGFGLFKPYDRPLNWGSQSVPKRWVER